MRRTLISAGGFMACMVAAGAIAQNAQDVPMPEVTVESHRAVATTIGKSASGVPILDTSLGYTVSAQGLDLSSRIGAQAFEARVRDAAEVACQELGRRYPASLSTPAEDAACAKAATEKAMVKVHALEDAATKNASANKK